MHISGAEVLKEISVSKPRNQELIGRQSKKISKQGNVIME